MVKLDITALRQEYKLKMLNKKDLDADPIIQFGTWFEEATFAQEFEPNAMSLATADTSGMPSIRMVLLKGVENGGFYFYTNYESQKAIELEQNPKASLLFWWQTIERQVRISGLVRKTRPDESDEYFNSRPIGSRIGAISSPQSRVIKNRKELETAYSEALEAYSKTEKILRPPNWGGYVLLPDRFEFWQGRQNRLHDRISYRKTADKWIIERLAP